MHFLRENRSNFWYVSTRLSHMNSLGNLQVEVGNALIVIIWHLFYLKLYMRLASRLEIMTSHLLTEFEFILYRNGFLRRKSMFWYSFLELKVLQIQQNIIFWYILHNFSGLPADSPWGIPSDVKKTMPFDISRQLFLIRFEKNSRIWSRKCLSNPQSQKLIIYKHESRRVASSGIESLQTSIIIMVLHCKTRVLKHTRNFRSIKRRFLSFCHR